jgi:hypothetical protein
MRPFFLRGVTWRAVALIACEAVVILASVYLAAFLRLAGADLDDVRWTEGIFARAMIIAVTTQICM